MPKVTLLKISRLAGLTDGIFAIAMTILVYGITLPRHTDAYHLLVNLDREILGKLFIYAGSFFILGTQWIGISFQHGFLRRLNRPYLWTNIFYLMLVCLIPFSATLLASFRHSVVSISFYAINLLCTSFGMLLIWQCAHYYNLNGSKYSPQARKDVLQRIMIGPLFYAASLIIAHWNIPLAFIALVIPPLIHLFPGKVDKYDHDEI